MKPKLTVYIRTVKVPANGELIQEPYRIKRGYGPYEVSRHTMYQPKEYSYILSDNQKTVVELIKQLGEKYGFECKVIDVAKENAVQKLLKGMKNIKNFPIIETDQGTTLRPPFSRGELERFISGMALQ